MRGSYNTTHEDRRRFLHALCQVITHPATHYGLINTQLCMSNCKDLLEELGYEKEHSDTYGWEGELEMWFSHPKAPTIVLSASAYLGDLIMRFPCYDDGEEPNVETLGEAMKEHWGKYFEVV